MIQSKYSNINEKKKHLNKKNHIQELKLVYGFCKGLFSSSNAAISVKSYPTN